LPTQKEQVQKLFESMKAETTPIGAKLIEQEGALDQQFASRSITPDALKDATANIGATQAELRNAHLKYHLGTAQILSPDQMKQYADLRGYTSDAPAGHHRMHKRETGPGIRGHGRRPVEAPRNYNRARRSSNPQTKARADSTTQSRKLG
jgi:hypothetical protein